MSFRNDIKVNITAGGLGRLATGKDYYSGVIFQSATAPAGWDAGGINLIYSLAEAESLGLTAALFPIEHYHVSEYFRVLNKFNFNGLLYVYFANIVALAYDGTEIATLQSFADNDLRQVGVFLTDAYTDGMITDSQSVCATLDTAGYPLSVLIAADVADYTALADARTLSSKWVTPVLGQDGGGVGAALFVSESTSITCLGAALATAAYSKVYESLGYVDKFDVSGATELQTLALADGVTIKSLSDTAIDAIDEDGFLILVKRRVSGSYFYDSPTAEAANSDFAFIENNRTIAKAKRLILQFLAPLQNAPLRVNPVSGALTEQTIAIFDNATRRALNNMAINEEIGVEEASGRIPQNSVDINPNQDVITTSKIVINVKIIPIGVARIIEVPLSFALSV